MLKNVSRLEYIIEGRVYHLTCDQDSPLNHVKEALVKFISYVTQVEDVLNAQQKAEQEKSDAEKQAFPIQDILKEAENE